MFKRLLLASLLMGLLSACYQTDIIENIGFIHTIGYDLAEEEDLLRVTVSLPLADKRQKHTISTLAHTSKEASIYLSNQSDKNLVTGQVRSILVGKKLAEQGIWRELDTIYRDNVFRPNIRLAVVDGDVEKLMEGNFSELPELNESIEDMLKKEAKLNTIPDVDVHKFARDYLDDAIDPIAPIIRKTDKGIMATGIALFKDDQFVTNLNTLQSRIFFLMTGQFKEGDLLIKNKDELIFVDFLSSKHHVTVDLISLEDIHIGLKIIFTGYVLEYHGARDLSMEEGIKDLERVIERYIEKEIKEIIQIMKQYKVDNAGFGKYVRMNTDYQTWKRLKWPETVDHVQITPSVDVKILDAGLINR